MSKFNTEKELKICSLYKEGKNTVEIAKQFNTYNTSIRRVLLRNNIILRKCGEAQKYSNNNLFENLNLSNEESYYLGLLVTDGCISNNRISLSFKEEDVYMLENFAKFLGPKVNVNSYFHKKHNKLQYMVGARNTQVCNNLKKLAVFVNKSYDLKLNIPLNFNILRGIIDGDGSVINNKNKIYIKIFGVSEEFLKQIQEYLKIFNVKSVIKKEKTCSCLSIYNQKDVLFLYKKMYYSTDLFLIRKKNKYGPLLEKSLS